MNVSWGSKSEIMSHLTGLSYYAHTNWFCVVQENIRPELLKVQTELVRSVHEDRGLCVFLSNNETGNYEFYYLIASNFNSYQTHFVNAMSFEFIVNVTGLKQLLWR